MGDEKMTSPDESLAVTAVHLDADVLQGLPGDSLMLQKILKMFLKSSEELVTMMETGIENNDAAQVAYAAHTLKSSSATVGAMQLSEQCEKVEAITKHDGFTELALMVQQVRQFRQLVENECLTSYLINELK